MYGLVGAAIFATYARLPVQDLYHVSTNGRWAAAGRLIVFLNWPTALAAIALAGIVAAFAESTVIRRLAALSILLCATVAWPGMVDQVDLDAKPANLIPASGVLLALALTMAATRTTGLGPRLKVRGDGIRVVAAVVLVLLALAWIVADLGVLIGRWPVLGSLFYSDEWWARFGHARLQHAVHQGHHHGMDGTLLALTAIVLSRTLGGLPRRSRLALGAYLALMLAYGLAVAANDFWLEQVVKRDIGMQWEIPSVIVPRPSLAWLVVLVVAAVIFLALFRRTPAESTVASRPLRWPFATGIVMTALVVVGLLHGPTRHRTELASVDGIALVAAPDGTPHLYVTGGGRLVRLTERDEAELAPSWSRDGRLAFQSKADGDWELFGANMRPLTQDDGDSGEPRWHPDGKRIAFIRNHDLLVLHANGTVTRVAEGADSPSWSSDGSFLVYETRPGAKHGLIGFDNRGHHLATPSGEDLRYPAWSPQAKVLAYECLRDDHWHICVGDRAITKGKSNDFAPAWSPDGSRIAFISDRDGNDQLYVMRADGTGIRGVTTGQSDKDTPAWRP
jgi:Tol biopolymer transport system component